MSSVFSSATAIWCAIARSSSSPWSCHGCAALTMSAPSSSEPAATGTASARPETPRRRSVSDGELCSISSSTSAVSPPAGSPSPGGSAATTTSRPDGSSSSSRQWSHGSSSRTPVVATR